MKKTLLLDEKIIIYFERDLVSLIFLVIKYYDIFEINFDILKLMKFLKNTSLIYFLNSL